MRGVLWEGDADLLALSRPLVMEPDLPNVWRQNVSDRARSISCNGCFRPALKGEGIDCVVNRLAEENPAPIG